MTRGGAFVITRRFEALKAAIERRSWDDVEWHFDNTHSGVARLLGTRDRPYDHEARLGAVGLELDPTAAMLAGEQQVFQHSWCGTVVVWHPQPGRAALGPCPACDHPDDRWWRQSLPIAGLRNRPAEVDAQ